MLVAGMVAGSSTPPCRCRSAAAYSAAGGSGEPLVSNSERTRLAAHRRSAASATDTASSESGAWLSNPLGFEALLRPSRLRLTLDAAALTVAEVHVDALSEQICFLLGETTPTMTVTR